MGQAFFPHTGLPGLTKGRYLVPVPLSKVPEKFAFGFPPTVLLTQNLDAVIGQSLGKPVQ